MKTGADDDTVLVGASGPVLFNGNTKLLMGSGDHDVWRVNVPAIAGSTATKVVLNGGGGANDTIDANPGAVTQAQLEAMGFKVTKFEHFA